ncbi:MAG: hypothetical protein MZW92_43710 [Comamonadaceae bacterium]|nr:hypothetical protein [Comamonadaceae bacterium]
MSVGIWASQREHRDQPAGVPATRSGAGLPGLLRAASWNRTTSSTTACTGFTSSDNWYASSWYNGPWGMVGPGSQCR